MIPPAFSASAKRRIINELRNASEPDMGTYIEPEPNEQELDGPFYAVLVSWHSHAVPALVRITLGAYYPYHAPKLKFMSRVPHPLMTADGTLDLDILHSMWSPALTIRSLLVTVQDVLARPRDFDRHTSCVHDPDWELGVFATSAEHHPMIFGLLLKASFPPVQAGSPNWFSWRYIRGMRSVLCMHPFVYTASPREWYKLLRSLADLFVTLDGYTLPADPSASDVAKQLWIRESQGILKEHFCFDSLRMTLCIHSLGLGDLRKIQRVWSVIRAFLSDIENAELFGNNQFLLNIVNRDSMNAHGR